MTAALKFRRARASDARGVWEVRNEPAVRRASFQARRLPFPEHRAWFLGKVKAPDCRLWVAEKNGAVQGFVRIDKRKAGTGDISIALKPASRGQGLGRRLIHRAVRLGARQMKLRRVLARVKPGNKASLRAFEAADFKPVKGRKQNGRLMLAWHKETRKN